MTKQEIKNWIDKDDYPMYAAPALAKQCIELMEENEQLNGDTYSAVRALGQIVNEHQVSHAPDIAKFAAFNLEALEQQRHADYINSLLNKITRLKDKITELEEDRDALPDPELPE